MATDQWAWDNTAFEDGLKNVFEPRQKADEAFKRGQGIIKDAYAIDEQQALLPTKLAQSMVDRRKAEANLQYYEQNPNALVDAIGTEFDKTKAVNQNITGEAQDKINARNDLRSMEELIASKSFITTPEIKNDDGTVRVPTTERPTTEIERYELAAASAPTYRQQQAIGAMVKAKYSDVVNQAVAQEDFVGAHEAAKKAGLITGDAKLTRLSDDTYTIQTTYGGTRQIGKQALQQMFFSQATKEKLAIENQKAAGEIAARATTGKYNVDVATLNANGRVDAATATANSRVEAARLTGQSKEKVTGMMYGDENTANSQPSNGAASFNRGGVAAQPTNQATNSRSKFASTSDEMNIPLTLNKEADETELKIVKFTNDVSKAPNDQELKAKLAREESNLAQIAEEMQRMKIKRVRSASQSQSNIQSVPPLQSSAQNFALTKESSNFLNKIPEQERIAFKKYVESLTPDVQSKFAGMQNANGGDAFRESLVNKFRAVKQKSSGGATGSY